MNTRMLLHITAPVVATSLLMLALGVGTAWYVHRFYERVSADLRTNISGLRAGEEVEIFVREIRTQLDYYIINKGDAKYLRAITDAELLKETDTWLHNAEACSTTLAKKGLMAQARTGYDRLLSDLAYLKGKTWDESLRLKVRDTIDNVLKKEIQDPAHEYLDLNENEIEQAWKYNQTFADRLGYGLFFLGLCGSGAGLLAGYGLARGINRRLVQLSVPIRNAAGRLDEVVGPITFDAQADLEQIENVLHVISDRIGAIIERLRESERQVLQTEQLAWVGQMAAGMAHELRNPLTSMKILVQAAMAADGAKHELAGRDLIVLEEEITRLERLVQSFVEFARPPQIEKRTLEVGPLIDQAVNLLGGTGCSHRHAHPARYSTRADPGRPRSRSVSPGAAELAVERPRGGRIGACSRGSA